MWLAPYVFLICRVLGCLHKQPEADPGFHLWVMDHNLYYLLGYGSQSVCLTGRVSI